MQEGELDFLLLDPSRGALGLEVKGGRVERTPAGWFSLDRYGQKHAIKDPGRQASSSIHAIGKYWKEAPGFGGRGFRCGFCWGVVLPDIEMPSPSDMGPDLPRTVIVDRSDFENLRRAIDRVFRSLGDRRESLSSVAVKAFIDVLLERCPPASRLALQFKEENRDLLRLTEDQMTLLDSLAAHNRAAIEGAAGTGKTVLAMEKARRLATTGKRVLLLCFNEPLARDLSQKADGFEAETFHDFCRRLARRAGLSGFAAQYPQVQERRVYAEEAPMMLLDALARLPDERYDAIVVDEAQDFLPDWWPCLDEALRHGRQGTLYAFYDANQDIYDGGPPGALEVIEHKLVHNCRNTTRIAEYAAGLVGTEPRVKAGAPQGRPVERIACASDAEVVRKVAARLDQLVLREDVAPDEIAIVSTRTLKNSPFAHDRRAGRFELVNLDDRAGRSSAAPPASRVVFETLYRFKGLERDVVILLDLPGSRVTDRHRYVAASRARNLLAVVSLA